MAMQLQRITGKGRLTIYPAKYGSMNQHKFKHLGIVPFRTTPEDTSKLSNSSVGLHVTTTTSYPLVKPLPLPSNIEDIDASEKAQFSPQRERDISGPVIISKIMGSFGNEFKRDYNNQSSPSDLHVASYDCRGTISLNCTMQTNVPEPFSASGKSTHLNMPGGQWGQGHKWVSEDMQNLHYVNLSRGTGNSGGQQNGGGQSVA